MNSRPRTTTEYLMIAKMQAKELKTLQQELKKLTRENQSLKLAYAKFLLKQGHPPAKIMKKLKISDTWFNANVKPS